MKDNGYKDELLYIKNYSKHEKDKLRIDFIIKMINDVGLDKINDIVIKDNEIMILLKYNFIEQEKIIYSRLVNINQGYFILESYIYFKLFSQKIYITHWFNHKFNFQNSNLYPMRLYCHEYQNIYKVYKDKRKNTVLCKNKNTEIFDIKIPDYLNYIYNTSKDIEKELMELKLYEKDMLDFIKNDYPEIIIKTEHNRHIKLINNFFNKNEFLTKDNLYNLIEYNYEYGVPYINAFIMKIFENLLSKFV